MPTETSLNFNVYNHEYFESPEGQSTVTKFIDELKTEVGNQDGYLEICKRADKDITRLDSETLEKLFDRFGGLIENTPPGHDVNHIKRDTLAGLALITNDPFIKTAFSKADIQAAILGSVFHDIGTAIYKRYEDNVRPNGHAEMGAYIFWKNSEGIINEDVRKLTAYAIATHAHFLNPIPIKEPQGYEKQPYWYEIFYPEKERPCGLAPIITRFSDRLDANGAPHTVRTMLANADASQTGGQEFAGEAGFFEINKDSLTTLFLPNVRKEEPKPQSTLEHTLMFADSNFGNSEYSRDDHLFPLMEKLMEVKVKQTHKLIEIVSTPPDMMEFDENQAKLLAKTVMFQISGSKNFERSWDVLAQVWDDLNPEVQARWINGFKYIQRSYVDWLDLILGKVGEEYKEFASKLARECL